MPHTEEEKRKRAQSLVGSSEGRAENDFYPTPPEATQALLDVESFSGSIWEPACGDGAMCKVFEANGFKDILATDLIFRGYGQGEHDFLTSTLQADNIITNPPFALGEAFVRKALQCSTKKVAMLTKLAFLEGQKRRSLFESTPPARVHVFSKRVSFYREGKKGSYSSSMIAFCWMVWDHEHEGPSTLNWI